MVGLNRGARREELAAEQGIYNASIVETQGIGDLCYSSRHLLTPRLRGRQVPFPIVSMSMTQMRDLACRTDGFGSCASTFGLNDHRSTNSPQKAIIEVSEMHLRAQRHEPYLQIKPKSAFVGAASLRALLLHCHSINISVVSATNIIGKWSMVL